MVESPDFRHLLLSEISQHVLAYQVPSSYHQLSWCRKSSVGCKSQGRPAPVLSLPWDKVQVQCQHNHSELLQHLRNWVYNPAIWNVHRGVHSVEVSPWQRMCYGLETSATSLKEGWIAGLALLAALGARNVWKPIRLEVGLFILAFPLVNSSQRMVSCYRSFVPRMNLR